MCISNCLILYGPYIKLYYVGHIIWALLAIRYGSSCSIWYGTAIIPGKSLKWSTSKSTHFPPKFMLVPYSWKNFSVRKTWVDFYGRTINRKLSILLRRVFKVMVRVALLANQIAIFWKTANQRPTSNHQFENLFLYIYFKERNQNLI